MTQLATSHKMESECEREQCICYKVVHYMTHSWHAAGMSVQPEGSPTAAVPLLPACLPAGRTDGQCESDAQCGKGNICHQTTTTSVCTCSDGADSCVQLGTCIKFCDSAQAQRKLALANNQVVVCDPFLPNTCSGGLVCQTSSAGVQLVCSDEAGIVPVEVGGVCVPAKRELLSARFSADGRQISIALNAATRTAAFSCSSLFTAANSTALGARAWCSAADRVVTVQFGGPATILPGATLSLAADQTVLVDKLQSDVAFKGSVVVATCSECSPPIATVTGPQVRVSCAVATKCCCQCVVLACCGSSPQHGMPAAHSNFKKLLQQVFDALCGCTCRSLQSPATPRQRLPLCLTPASAPTPLGAPSSRWSGVRTWQPATTRCWQQWSTRSIREAPSKQRAC